MDGPRGLALAAGPLRTRLVDGRLMPVVAHGHELWHGVHFLLRDEHWRTPPLRLEPAGHERLPQGWRVVAQGHFDVQPPVRLRLTVEGHDEGWIEVTGEAWPMGELAANRLGLCLLHGDHTAGSAVAVEHTDGRLTQSTLPRQVPPWPPFGDIRALRHEVTPGAWACARFEGEAFELEDQRNNADASFKTYSRSNFLPRPMRLREGEPLWQRLRLSLQGEAPAPAPPPVRQLALPCPADAPRPLVLGLELCAADLQDVERSIERARTARPDRLHWVPGPGDDRDVPALARLLQGCGLPLRLDLADLPPARSTVDIERWALHLAEVGIVPAEVAVFPSTPEAVAAARRAFPPGTRVGGGTADFFVQLNRQDRLPKLDFLAFTVCPIVHGVDDDSLMAGTRSLRPMLQTLHARWPGVPVQLGPSGIAARRSPLGERAHPAPGERAPLGATDPREADAFGAAWTLAHIGAALDAGAEAVTVGTLARSAEAPLQALWRELAARRDGAALSPLRPPAGLPLGGLSVHRADGGVRQLIVNLDAESIDLTPGGPLRPHAWRTSK